MLEIQCDGISLCKKKNPNLSLAIAADLIIQTFLLQMVLEFVRELILGQQMQA